MPEVVGGDKIWLWVYFVVDACLHFVVFVSVFSTKPRDWLKRTSPKWPILCRAGCKTLINQSIVSAADLFIVFL